jgi:glutathione S-transferase
MQLYFHPMSSNARRARMAAIQLGLSPELVLIDLRAGAQRRPEYLAINPNGKVPTLVDGEVVVWESLAIMIYLAEQTPGQTIYPADRVARTHVNQWLFWTANHWSPAIAQLNYERFLKPMFGQGEPNDYAVQRALGMFADFARVLDGQLARSRHVTGEALTVVDLAIAAPLMYVDAVKLPVDASPHVQRWLGEIRALEAWRATEPPRP